MKIIYYCPNIVQCIAQKLNIRICTFSMKQKVEEAPTQLDIKKIDKQIKNYLSKNNKCD